MHWLLAPPFATSEEQTQRARMFNTVAWSTIVVATVLLTVLIVVQPVLTRRAAMAMGVVDGLCLILIAVCRRGRTRLASWLLVAGLVAWVTTLAPTAGGIRSPGVTMYFIFVLIAGLLLGQRAAIVTALVCMTLAVGLVLLESFDRLPEESAHYGPIALLLLNILYMGVVIALAGLATRSIGDALKRAESELEERRQTEQRLQLALDAGQIGIWGHDPETGHFSGDARAFRLFGLPAPPDSRMTLETWTNMVHPSDLPAVQQQFEGLTGSPRHELAEYRILRADGAQRHMEVAASSVEVERGRPLRIEGVIKDVTARKTAEYERERLLLQLRERVKELDLLHALARLLRDRPFNQGLLTEVVTKLPSGWMHPECCEARITYRDMEASTPGWRRTPWYLAAPFVTSAGDGVIEIVYLEQRPLASEGPFLEEERDVLNSIVDMLVAYLEREHAEHRRKGLEGQLRQSQKMEALGTLAGGIAHDFNNILTAIGGNVDLALAETPGGSVRTSLVEIVKAHARAADLVRRILVFSRRQEAIRAIIELPPVIDEALRLLRVSLPPGIQLEASYEPHLPAVSADATQIHQIIMNLGTNAGHAMSESGGVLSVSVAQVLIGEAGDAPSVDLRPGNHLRVTVRDAGMGMSREILERLFEPFFTTKGMGGTGLGLSVVHGIVRDHDGAITVDSELGRGTTFEIYFPCAVEAAVQEEKRTAGPSAGSGEHIMYVDNEESLVFVMTRIFERLGYRCTGYSDANEALQAFRTTPHAFHAVVTDLAMPAMTGVDLARALRAIRPELPVAVASGYGRNEHRDADANIAAWIPKPSTLEELSGILRGMLHRAA